MKNKELKAIKSHLKDLEAELGYYCIYEPDNTKNISALERKIDRESDKFNDLSLRIEREELDGVKESSFSNKKQ